jgi:DUF971 family protein
MTSEIKPVSITANRTIGQLIIGWNDGHTSSYPFSLMRAACPCASCRGGHENMSPEPDPAVFNKQLSDSPATHLKSISAVGSYGLTIEWEDGHHYGIYNWHYLRNLCPCQECRTSINLNN